MQALAAVRAPFLRWHPNLPAGRWIGFARQPDHGRIVHLRLLSAMMRAQVAVESAGAIRIDPRRRHVIAFLIRAGEHAVRTHAEPDRMPDAGGENLELSAILADAEQAAARRR